MSDWRQHKWTSDQENEIEKRAYFKWLNAGRPDINFWYRAAEEMFAEMVTSRNDFPEKLSCPTCYNLLWESDKWLDACPCGWTEPIEVLEVVFRSPTAHKVRPLGDLFHFNFSMPERIVYTPTIRW